MPRPFGRKEQGVRHKIGVTAEAVARPSCRRGGRGSTASSAIDFSADGAGWLGACSVVAVCAAPFHGRGVVEVPLGLDVRVARPC